MCVCCFLGDVCEGVGKSNVRVTGRVSHHSLPHCGPLGFLEGAECRVWLVTKASTRHVMFHLIAIAGFQPVGGSRHTHL